MAFLDIVATLGARTSQRISPALPHGRSVVLPSLEDEPIAPPSAGDTAPMGLFIVYCDSAGRQSQRRVTCKTFEADKGNLLAWCHERGAFRRFKVARIQEAVIASTGEVIDVVALMQMTPVGDSPIGDRALQRLLTILVFTMKCDGRAHHNERSEIEDAVASYALRFEKDDTVVARACERAMALAPDMDDLVSALRWIEEHRDGHKLARMLLPFIERVIVADGEIASQEAYFGGMISDALRAITSSQPAF